MKSSGMVGRGNACVTGGESSGWMFFMALTVGSTVRHPGGDREE